MGKISNPLGLFPYLRNGLMVPNFCGCCKSQASFRQSPPLHGWQRGCPTQLVFVFFYLYCHPCLFQKTCLLQQRLTAICHPNTSTEATCPPNPDTTQADESSSLNKAYHQSGEMRGFDWAGKRKRVSKLADGGLSVASMSVA